MLTGVRAQPCAKTKNPSIDAVEGNDVTVTPTNATKGFRGEDRCEISAGNLTGGLPKTCLPTTTTSEKPDGKVLHPNTIGVDGGRRPQRSGRGRA